MTRIHFEDINHLGLEKRFFGFEQQNRAPAGWESVSVPTAPIRGIVRIVVHPRELLAVRLTNQEECHAENHVQGK